jgi:hypothetical protein
MKLRLLILALLATAAAVGYIVHEDGRETGELAEVMAEMGAAWHKARLQVADPTRTADTIARFAALKQGMATALALEPAAVADLPPDEQPKFLAAYQAKLKEQMATIDEIVSLLRAGKNREAAVLTKTMEAK